MDYQAGSLKLLIIISTLWRILWRAQLLENTTRKWETCKTVRDNMSTRS